MAKQIRVSTEWLQDCADQMRSVQSAVERAANTLSNIDIDEVSGGSKRVSYSFRLRSSGESYRGSDVEAAVRASVRGLRSLAREVEDTGSAVRSNAERFEEIEQLVNALFLAVGAGNAAGRVGNGSVISADASYKATYKSRQQVLDKNRKAWEEQDALIDTDYNRELMQELENAIMNHPAFSNAAWKKCTTAEQKERFIRNMYSVIEEIYGTELSHDLAFVRGSDFNGNNATVRLDDGTELNYQSSWLGVYYQMDTDGDSVADSDAIIMRVDNRTDLAGIVSTLCHENRHNLQSEIIMADDLSEYASVGSDDYNQIMSAKQTWIREEPNRYVITPEDVDNRANEIVSEMGFFQKFLKSDNQILNEAKGYADVELYEDYAQAQKEVDARYAGEFAADCMDKRKVQDFFSGIFGGGDNSNARGGGGGGARH